MNKKNKIILICISALLLIIIASVIIIPLTINGKIKKEKNKALDNTKELVKIITDNCNKKSTDKVAKYVIKDGALPNLETNSVKVKINDIDESLIKDVLPADGVIEVSNECEVTLSVLYGEYNIIKKEKQDAEIVENNLYENGTVIYFNPTENKVCNNYDEKNNIEGCLKWYAINDQERNNTVTLLLDHNILANFKWVIKSDYLSTGGTDYENNGNESGPITLRNKLYSLTKEWTAVPRLVDASEIADVAQIYSFKENKTQSYFFESGKEKPAKSCYKGNINKCTYGYLYDRTSQNASEYGALNNTSDATYGYWTNTANSSAKNRAWRVYFDGRLISSNINDVGSGIRPVIDIQKSLLK
ncbi:MAG TPA: hypothetical protein PLV83_02995 [Bacilli bacterium]|nr:hypothetical protein [Bacilli bacterium]